MWLAVGRALALNSPRCSRKLTMRLWSLVIIAAAAPIVVIYTALRIRKTSTSDVGAAKATAVVTPGNRITPTTTAKFRAGCRAMRKSLVLSVDEPSIPPSGIVEIPYSVYAARDVLGVHVSYRLPPGGEVLGHVQVPEQLHSGQVCTGILIVRLPNPGGSRMVLLGAKGETGVGNDLEIPSPIADPVALFVTDQDLQVDPVGVLVETDGVLSYDFPAMHQ